MLATGIGKLLDIPGFIGVLETYRLFPAWVHPVVAVGMVLIELRLAEWLLLGKRLVRTAFFSVLLHSAFTFVSAMTLLRGLELPNCGCFGVFLARPLTWWTVVEDLVLVGMSLILMMIAFKEKKEKQMTPSLFNSSKAPTQVF